MTPGPRERRACPPSQRRGTQDARIVAPWLCVLGVPPHVRKLRLIAQYRHVRTCISEWAVRPYLSQDFPRHLDLVMDMSGERRKIAAADRWFARQMKCLLSIENEISRSPRPPRLRGESHG